MLLPKRGWMAKSQDLGGKVVWFNPSQQPSPTQPLAHSPLVGWGKRIGKVKVRKLVG